MLVVLSFFLFILKFSLSLDRVVVVVLLCENKFQVVSFQVQSDQEVGCILITRETSEVSHSRRDHEEGFTLVAAQDDVAFTAILLFVLQHIFQFHIAESRQKSRSDLAA